MDEINSLKKAQKEAYEVYTIAKTEILTAPDMATAAQRANEAWLAFKKLDTEFNNILIAKTRRDLYGCN